MSAAQSARGARPGTRDVVAAVTTAAVLWTAAVSVQAVRDGRYPVKAIGADLLYLRSGSIAGRLALAYDALLADVYWIRAIQHYGDTRVSKNAQKDYALLYPLLDLTTSLDRHFTIAYRFGAIFLAEPYPDGPGRPDLAITLLEKGLAADPDRWQYAQDAGFVYYWWVHDYKAAAGWFDRAGRIPGAPWWLRSMAATVLVQGGDRQSSRQLWQQLYATAEDGWVKNNAQLKLAQLNALDEIDALAAMVRRYAAVTGRAPAAWTDLVAARWLAAIPRDPSGEPYVLDATQPGGVALARRSALYPLPSFFGPKAGPPS